MAFELGKFLMLLTADTTGVDSAVKTLGTKFKGVADAMKYAGNQSLKPKDAEEAEKKLNEMAEAGKSLNANLAEMTGFSFDNILKLGSLAGVIGLIKGATSSFMELSDEMTNTEIRFQAMGMAGKQNAKELFDFGEKAQAEFGKSAKEMRALATHALEQAVNPSRYKEMAASAVALAATTGKSVDTAMRAIEQMEAGNMRGMGQMHQSIKQMIKMGADRISIEAQVNRLIGMGGEIQKQRMKTFAGQVEQLKLSFTRLRIAVGNAIGPAVVPLIQVLSKAMQGLAERVENIVKNNGPAIQSFIKIAGSAALAAFAFTHMGGILGKVGGITRFLLPGISSLRSVLSAGWNFDALGKVKGVIYGAFSGLRALPKSIQKLAMFVAKDLLGAFVTFAAGVINPMNLVRNAVALIGVAGRLAAGGIGALKTAIRGLLLASGIGIFVGLIGALAGAVDTFGEASGAADGLQEALKEIAKEAQQYIKPVMEWIKTEGVIIFKALTAAARQMIENAKMLWQNLKDTWKTVVTFFRENFSGALDWLNAKFGTSVENVTDLWAEFTAELAVLGLRIRQVFLLVIITIHRVGYVFQWVAEVAQAVGKHIRDNFMDVMLGGLKNVWNMIKLLGVALGDLAVNMERFLARDFGAVDFSKTKQAMNELVEGVKHQFKGIELPKFRIDDISSGLKGEFDSLSKEIAAKKQQAREAQALERTKRQDAATGKTSGDGTHLKSGVAAGAQDKAHFTDVVGFWKKIQEAGATSRAEYLMQQQVDQQREMVRILTAIHANSSGKPAVAGGVVPR